MIYKDFKQKNCSLTESQACPEFQYAIVTDMNIRKKEKILQVFIREVLKKNFRQSESSEYFDPVKTICNIILEQSEYTPSDTASRKDQSQIQKQDESTGNILTRFKTLFQKKGLESPGSVTSPINIQGKLSHSRKQSMLPDSLNQKALELLKNMPTEEDLSFFEQSIRDYIFKPVIFHQLLDHIQLRLEVNALSEKDFSAFLTSKKIDLKENAFYSWLIKQEFISKLDYGNLDLGSTANIQRFVLEDKLLGTVCFCDISGNEVKEHVHSYLKNKYKTSKIPDLFLDLFAKNRENQKYFGKIIIIFGFYVIFFSFEDSIQFLQQNCAQSSKSKDIEQWSSKNFINYVLDSFQDGINLKYPFSHYRACKLPFDDTAKKIAVVLWHQAVRRENLRREQSPITKSKKQAAKEKKEIIRIEDINNSRMLSLLRGVVEEKTQLAVQPGKGETRFFSLTCIPVRIEEDRLVLAMKKDKWPFAAEHDHLNLTCRFAFAGAKEKIRYYRFQSQLINTRNLGKNILGLEIILPKDYHISERQAFRYSPKPGEIEGLLAWIYSDCSPDLVISKQEPFAAYPSANENLKIVNVSSGGARLSIKNSLLRSRNLSCALNNQYVLKFLLSQDSHTKDLKGQLGSSQESLANNEIYINSAARNINVEPDQNGHTSLGLQFIQEASPTAGGKLTWSDIQTTGSWHIGNWIFSRNVQTKK